MKRIIHLVFIIVLYTLPYPALSQQDTIIYTGVNGTLTTEDKADTRKEIHYQSTSRIEIITSKWMGKKWQITLEEQITREKENRYRIINKKDKKSDPVIRQYSRLEDGTYLFREYIGKSLIRSGRTMRMFPVILDGACEEYYKSGQLKSRSVYSHDELVGNQNWLENGETYIDTVFYSADVEPLLTGGDAKIQQHVLQTFKNTGLDFTSVSGRVVVGFVVMETGEIKGVRIMKSLSSQIDLIAIFAIQSLNGNWSPARLHGKPVRYFQLFPINFIVKESTFQYMEFNGSMIYYNTNW